MNNPTPTPTPDSAPKPLPGPIQCFVSSVVAGGIAIGFYILTQSISSAFASHPIRTSNTITLNISAAVRTLIVGMGALGTGVFALVAFGLMALGVQVLFQRFSQQSPADHPPADPK